MEGGALRKKFKVSSYDRLRSTLLYEVASGDGCYRFSRVRGVEQNGKWH
jgi:hypothetical protein